MREISKPPKRTYYIAHNKKGIYHVGYVEPNQVVTTGQPELDADEKESDCVLRCDALAKATPYKTPYVDRLKEIVAAGKVSVSVANVQAMRSSQEELFGWK